MVAHGIGSSNATLISDTTNAATVISDAGIQPAVAKQALSVEVRSRTKGVLPTSVVLHVAHHSTVDHVKKQLEGCVQAPHTLTANQIKLVYAGHALANDETLSFIAAESTTTSEITVHAVLLAPGEKSSAPTSVKVSSVSASPLGSPRYSSSQHSSFPSSPGGATSPGTSPQAIDPQWVDGLKRQVELGMRKAFFDLIDKALSEEQPDPEWITRLYAEMRDKLCALTPRRTDMHQQIHEALNVDLFEEMVRHKAFDPAELLALVAFVFGRLQGLCSPSRDAEVKGRRGQLEDIMAQPDVTFAKFAVAFLKAFHATIEDIENDLAEFKKLMSSPPAASKRPPSPGAAVVGSVEASLGGSPAVERDLKAKLRQMGVSDDVLNACADKSELDTLFERATGRATGTVSGGIVHPSLLNKSPIKTPSVARSLHMESDQHDRPAACGSDTAEGAATCTRECVSTVKVNFKVMLRSGAPLDKMIVLPRKLETPGARAAIARACGLAEEDGIKLVFAGRVLAEDELIGCLVVPLGEPLSIYVVLPKGR